MFEMYELLAVVLFVVVVLAFCVGYAMGMQRGLYLFCNPGEKRKTPLIRREVKVKVQPTGVTLHTAKDEAEIEKKLKKQDEEGEEEEEEELEE